MAALSAARNGRLEIADAIGCLIAPAAASSGPVPWCSSPNLEHLDKLVARLKTMGLDGLEAIYAQFSESERAASESWRASTTCSSAPGRTSTVNGVGTQPPVIAMPRADWVRFGTAVTAGTRFEGPEGRVAHRDPRPRPRPTRPTCRCALSFPPRSYVLRILLPTLAAMALFLVAIWGVILPSFEQSLLERKREMIRELTNSAWSILAAYQRDGGRPLARAGAGAWRRPVEALRYGPEGKDYFWLQDTAAAHHHAPLSAGFERPGLSDFADPRGVRIFVEFADLVAPEGEGYIDYVWQWKDDPQRLGRRNPTSRASRRGAGSSEPASTSMT